ncbi:hypothetical protein GHO45_02270 [Pseudomonas sp. FSL R10-0765]|uniref:hypothetical protein n=1 Tax=Pseudomonas sp. FSL R10-0765 TaxID=2662195 RepID=UPI0012951581|nr:hypothetical protein [Pseudomonas sp. FSL R10-0765]MQT39764.1 hypothetical protein [Pseudomonas sp. FSL R10-0765]
MAHLSLVPAQPKPPLSLMAPDFQPLLSKFNDLTRELRTAGAAIKALNFLDNRIVVSDADLDIIARRFAHEIRSQSSKTQEHLTRHSVLIRGIYVSWHSLVKEQNQ